MSTNGQPPSADLIREANDRYLEGRFADAERLYQRMLEDEPHNHEVLIMAGLCRRGQGDKSGAVARLREAVRHADGSAEAHYYLGRMLLESGQADSARESLAQALALNPNHVQARTLMGMSSLLAGRTSRAVEELKTAVRANPNHVPARAALARALLELGELEQARREATVAVQLDADDAGAQESMGRVFLAEHHPHFAEQCFRNGLERLPDHPPLMAMLGRALCAGGRDTDALAYFGKAMQAGHAEPEMVLDMATSLSRLQRTDEARTLLEQARQRWNRHEALAIRLIEHQLLDDDIDAASELAGALDSDAPALRLLKARIAHRVYDSERLAELLEGLRSEPSRKVQRQVRLLEARLAAADGKLEAGREALAPLIEMTPPDVEAMMQLATLYEGLGRADEVIATLRDLLERGTLGAEARAQLQQRLAVRLDQQGQFESAAVHLAGAGWRRAPALGALERQLESGLIERWTNTHIKLDPTPLDDGWPQPLVVLGWPGSGRELILAALSAHPGVQMLDPADSARRLSAIGYPLDPDLAGRLDEGRRLAGRKRFYRGVEKHLPNTLTVESVWHPVTVLPALAVYFPGLPIIVPHAAEQDLELHWRMLGYRDIDGMRSHYAAERRAFEHLIDLLPARFLPIRRAHLLKDPEAELSGLFERLELEWLDPVLEPAEAIRLSQPYRNDGHWRHYAALMRPDPSAPAPRARQV